MAISVATANTTPIISKSPVASKLTAAKKDAQMVSNSFEEPFTFDESLDEWLANDLQQTGLLFGADPPSLFSSPSLDDSPTTTFLGESPSTKVLSGDFDFAAQPLFGSPALGDLSSAFSPLSSSNASPLVTPSDMFEKSPVLDAEMAFFPDLNKASDAIRSTPSSNVKSEPQIPTAALVAQLAAAGAFNIPWGTEPASQQVPLHPIDPLQQAAAIAAAQAAADFRLAKANPLSQPPTMAAKRKTVDLEEVDPTDEVAFKRAKNTDAARRSRMKKLLKMEGLERRVADLEAENSKLVLKVAVLESEKTGGDAREQEYERRIKRLEDQLREAHKAVLDSRLP